MSETERQSPEPRAGSLTVGKVAALLGVSVRTLHHWDRIGLAVPSARTSPGYGSHPGYRTYANADIERLHQVLVYREIGFSLAQIAEVIDAPETDAGWHLANQRQLLLERIEHLRRMAAGVDRMREAIAAKENLAPEDIAEIFGAEWSPEYSEEAEQRWGGTRAWAQADERRRRMTRADWEHVKGEDERLEADLASAVDRGVAPGSEEAKELAERHRASVNQFYDCTHERHVCLARMFVTDEGSTQRYEAVKPGLTRWLRDAVYANARAHGVDPETASWD